MPPKNPKEIRLTGFAELPKAFADRSRQQWLVDAEHGDEASLRVFAQQHFATVPHDQRPILAQRCYVLAKQQLAAASFPKAEEWLRWAHQLDPGQELFNVRYRLLSRANAHRSETSRRLSLQELQRRLGVQCLVRPCMCTSHYQIAQCRGLLEPGFGQHTVVGGTVPTYTVAPYHAYAKQGEWTHLLHRVKHEPYDASLLEPLADILADFISEATPLLHSVDALVPIPAAPRKFAVRGFAPNDLMSRRLGSRLALPVYHVLRRRDGPDTHAATFHELASQFYIDRSTAHRLTGLSVLLVEDIWTKGRTIPMCADKLTPLRPAAVAAVALAKALW